MISLEEAILELKKEVGEFKYICEIGETDTNYVIELRSNTGKLLLFEPYQVNKFTREITSRDFYDDTPMRDIPVPEKYIFKKSTPGTGKICI